MPRGILTWTSIFDRFLIELGSKLRPPEPQKTVNFRLFFHTFCKIGLSKLRPILDPIWVPTCLHFPSQNPSKFDFEWHQKIMRFGHRFLCLFGTNLVPSWASTWTHLGSQEPPKSPPKTHLGARTRPDPQNDSKMEPPTLQNEAPDPPFWIAFDVNFGYMLMICSLLFLFIFGIDFGVDYTG